MAKINLLPWREELKKKHLQDFIILLFAGIVLTGAAMGGWHLHNENSITHQHNRNNYVKKEITIVEERIREIRELENKKNQLLSRMTVITRLQGSRPQIVRLMDEIVTTLPEGVFLTKIGQGGNNVSFEGRAQSNARVSSYMRNIENTRWMQNPKLEIIQNKDKTGTGFSHFKLSASQAAPKKKDEEQ